MTQPNGADARDERTRDPSYGVAPWNELNVRAATIHSCIEALLKEPEGRRPFLASRLLADYRWTYEARDGRYPAEVEVLVAALNRVARQEAPAPAETREPWRFCPWCGREDQHPRSECAVVLFECESCDVVGEFQPSMTGCAACGKPIVIGTESALQARFATPPAPGASEMRLTREQIEEALPPLGRIWCGQCEGWDHECGCSPSVVERYREFAIEDITALAAGESAPMEEPNA